MRFRDISFVGVLIFTSVGFAEEKSETTEDPELAKLRKVLDQSTEPFFVSLAKDASRATSSKAVLRWTNNERDSQSVGVVVLWIDKGQPLAAMATYNWMGNIHHEFDLLSHSPVIGTRNASTFWQPKAGLKFEAIPDAPGVEMSASARLRQMKKLADEFSATMMGWRGDKSDRAELRRLPRELYRYEPENSDIIDGAVFAFVLGNDPEALLLIEAVKGNPDKWQYAFVRQTSGELQARRDNKIVWEAARHLARNDPSAPGLSVPSQLNLKSELAK